MDAVSTPASRIRTIRCHRAFPSWSRSISYSACSVFVSLIMFLLCMFYEKSCFEEAAGKPFRQGCRKGAAGCSSAYYITGNQFFQGESPWEWGPLCIKRCRFSRPFHGFLTNPAQNAPLCFPLIFLLRAIDFPPARYYNTVYFLEIERSCTPWANTSGPTAFAAWPGGN